MIKAVFDPGFYACLTSFSSNVELLYSELNSVKNFAQKKTQFLITYKKLLNLIDLHVGFYVGCMLWGRYLKSLAAEKIEENPFIGQVYNRELFLSEINFIFDFVKHLDRDTKYYIGKPFKLEEEKLHVLDVYIKFIEANKGFVDIDTTDKIKLVGKLDEISNEDIEKFRQKIQDVIHSGKVEELLEFCDRI